jgi:hypothetical protein
VAKKETDQQVANRGVGGHLKAGVQNIKKTYDTLYNRSGPGGGASTVPTNLKIIATGKTSAKLGDDHKVPAATRAKMVGMGAASVTPLGPVAAAISGVKKSVEAKAQAKANIAAAKNPAPAKPAPTLAIKKPAAPATPGAKPAAPGAKPATPAAKVGVKPTTPPPATGPKLGVRKP